MNRRKIKLILITILLVGGIVAGCANEELREENEISEDEEDNQDKVKEEDDNKDTEKEPELTLTPINIGEKAPNFTLENLNGENVSLEDYRGKIVFINFWATWCPPCRKEMPDLNKLYLDNKEKDFVVLAVDVGESKSQVAKFIEDGGYQFPVVLDKNSDVATRYFLTGIPKTVVVDEEGVIRFVKIGMMVYPEMSQILESVRK